MKKILLVCNAGMSTSMLVAKMKKAAEILRKYRYVIYER